MPIQDLPWDPTYVDPTDRPGDGLLARFVGGRTGPLSLENGAAISFPWKRQQETAGTFPGTVQVYDNPTTEFMQITGPTLTSGSQRASIYLAGWNDGTASVGISNGPVSMFIASGQVQITGGSLVTDGVTIADDLAVPGDLTVGGSATVTGGITGASLGVSTTVSALTVTASGTVTGATITTGQATLTSSGTGTFNGLITGNAGIDTVGGTVSLASNNDVTITAVDDITISCGGSAGTLTLLATGTGTAGLLSDATGGVSYVQGGQVNIVGQTTTVNVSANTTVDINSGSAKSVRVNSYPVAAMRDREGAAFGTAPAITAATTGFKFQTGRQTVAFTAGAGVLTFLSAFATGVVNIVCTAESNDTVIAANPGGAVDATQFALTAFTAGAAVTGNVIVSYIVFGW